MSLAKKEEVCSHLPLRFGEPAVGVPIKKRPVSVSDKMAPSGLPFSINPSPPATEVSVSAAGASCGNGLLFNIANSDTNLMTKGKGIINSQIQDHANRSFTTLSMTSSNGVLFSGSNEIPAEGERAPAEETQNQKFLALDLQLASRRNGKNNSGSIVKEEKVDQIFPGFPSAQHLKNVQMESEINVSSNSSYEKLPNLDLNVPLDPADSPEGLPTMKENGNVLLHRALQHQKVQEPLAAPVSTVSSGLSRSIDNSLNLSNSYGLSHKSGPADLTLDLQLKPPARPELGVNWKGLAPAPELSLSLFGKPMDDPNALSASNALFNSEPAGSSKSFCEGVETPSSDKSPVDKTAELVPCNANPQNTTSSIVPGIDKMTTSSIVPGIDKMASNSLVKKEPEEPSQQHILNDVEKAHLLEQQNDGLLKTCAESEKTDSAPQVPRKTGLDLNSEIFPNNSVHNGLDVMNNDVPVPAVSLPVFRTPTMLAVPEVGKPVKCEESTIETPSPVVRAVSGHSSPLLAANSLPLESDVTCPSSLCSNTVCKPAVSHARSHENTTPRPCDANEASDALQSSSNSKAETLVLNSQVHAAIDGMSQGSAEMDCSDDDDNTVSRLPTAKPHVGSLGHGPTTEDVIHANNLCKDIKKEQDCGTQKDCSSLTNKVCMDSVDDDKCAKVREGAVSHSGEQGLQCEAFVSEESRKDQQLLTSDKNSPPLNAESSTHGGKTPTCSSSTDPLRSSTLQISTSQKMASTKQSPKTLENCLEKSKIPVIKSEKSLSPHSKSAASGSEDQAKNAAVKTEHHTESEEGAKQSDLHPKDSILGEDSELDGTSSSQPQSESGKVKSGSGKPEYDKSKLESCKTASIQNEKDKDGPLVGSHWRDMGYAYVNRNERWERFMESEREKNKGEYHGGKHDMINQRRADNRYGGRGAGSCGHARNFRGPRLGNDSETTFVDEPISGRRRPFEDDLGHFHRISHRRRRSPPSSCLLREMEIDGFHGRKIPGHRLLPRGQMEDLPDDMIEERFFLQHTHRQHTHGDHGFIHRQRSHSPVQRRGAPMHFHRVRSPEAMHRSPPLMRDDRAFLPHRRNARRHASPLDQIGHDERGMQRNTRRCGMIGSHQALEGDAFEPPLHPAHLAELHAEEELTDRRKYGDRRAYHRSLEAAAAGEEEADMLAYHEEEDMDFAEGGGPREHDCRYRNRLGHRARGEQEDGYRHRGPQGWRERDGDSNGSRQKRRKY
ncbi:hypothetical protein ACP4OV_002498 [Aristida adscensionis]